MIDKNNGAVYQDGNSVNEKNAEKKTTLSLNELNNENCAKETADLTAASFYGDENSVFSAKTVTVEERKEEKIGKENRSSENEPCENESCENEPCENESCENESCENESCENDGFNGGASPTLEDTDTEGEEAREETATEIRGERILSPDDIFSEEIEFEKPKQIDYPTEEPEEKSAEEDESLSYGQEDEEAEEREVIEAEDEAEKRDDDRQITMIHLPMREDSEQSEKESEESAEKPYNPEKPRMIDKAFEFVELLVFTLVAVIIISSFFFRHSIVDGPSMEQTLYHGEHLIITNLFYTPEQGDIVVCDDHTTILKKPIVKRVIATEGQRVTITPDGVVRVDGVAIPEEYVFTKEDYVYEPYDDVVPEGKIFVMGDHRDNSSDSRNALVGPIDVKSVLGKVVLRIYPFDRFGFVE